MRNPWQPPHAIVLMRVTIGAICSTILFMVSVSVVGCLMMTSRGFAAMMRLTV